MPLEKGGRADKIGNRYEVSCIIYEMLKVLNETNYSVTIETLGEDEIGTDILVIDNQGVKEHQQCKVRNASKEFWSLIDLSSRNILRNWKIQLLRDDTRRVSLVSPIGCSVLDDLHSRAVNTTNNPNNFYEHQIKTGIEEFKKAFEYFCKKMELDVNKTSNLERSINYLRRIQVKQMPEYTLRELILQEIDYYFITDKDIVYNAFITLINDCDIYGKEIDSLFLRNYFKSQNISMRMLEGDKRVFSHIELINQEYRKNFQVLEDGLIDRREFEECMNLIKNEQSFVIYGFAGYGKSGCTEAILNYCEKEYMPHIAIKLDRRIPHGNCKKWGEELGFTESIVYALDSVSKNKTAVLILDQLDALRWTQTNSSEALAVCMEIIKQVENLNNNRLRKIVIVFVCRTYDLKNDNNIRSLFKETDNKQKLWKKIEVRKLDRETVKNIVGIKYEQLTTKTKKLLHVPSNLYIWQHLDEKTKLEDYTTTSHLIGEWYQQICRSSHSIGIYEKDVKEAVKEITRKLDKMGRLYIPKNILDAGERELDYLKSAGFIIMDEQKIGFVHQSILDYFISNRMCKDYYNGESIEQIVGEKNKQTLSKRYQAQMFLQNLLENDVSDFLSAGDKLVDSLQIRPYIKYVFYEILRQLSAPDDIILKYIKEKCEDTSRCTYFLNNVVLGKYEYFAFLREAGILEKWMLDDTRKEIVFSLIETVIDYLGREDIEFIKKYSFNNEEDDMKFMRCFSYRIIDDSDELFELRMLFYNKYPSQLQKHYINFEVAIKKYETRAIRLIAVLLKNKISPKNKIRYKYEEELGNVPDSYLMRDGEYALNQFIQYIPHQKLEKLYLCEWSDSYFHHENLQRMVVGLLKKANYSIIKKDPEYFWQFYSSYMGKNYSVFDELILHGMRFLPNDYSNRIIEYLTGNFDKKVFDCTSDAENKLDLVKEVLKVHTQYCSDECLERFLLEVEKYNSPNIVKWYKDRINTNKENKDSRVYWSFWGDFQYQILQCIPNERLLSKDKDLLNVLERRFKEESNRYDNVGDGHSGWVQSPISGKKIGKRQWTQIITNNKLSSRKYIHTKEVDGGFVESSLEMFAQAFQGEVMVNPKEMINLVINNKENVLPNYVNALYSGIAYSDSTGLIEQELLEKVFSEFPFDIQNEKSRYFCEIIEKASVYNWSKSIIEKLKEIVLYYEEQEETLDNGQINCEGLINRSLNCVKGYALRAIGDILTKNYTLYEEFKEVIDKLLLEDAPTQMACLYVLYPIYDIDEVWAQEKMLYLYEKDIRMLSFQKSKDMLFSIYKKYNKRVLSLINKCFESSDEMLIKVGGYCICEFYIRHNKFENVISDINSLKKEQIEAILTMAILYLELGEYREKSKSIILQLKDYDCEISLDRMFFDNLVDAKRDYEFLSEIMKSKSSKNIVYSFIQFLEKNAYSIKEYAELIISLCESILNMTLEELSKQWGIENYISKLILSLYDETCNSNVLLDKEIAERCLDLWDVMFEKQFGQVRELSRQLMER